MFLGIQTHPYTLNVRVWYSNSLLIKLQYTGALKSYTFPNSLACIKTLQGPQHMDPCVHPYMCNSQVCLFILF